MKKLFRKIYRRELEAEGKRRFEEGCMTGYRNCESAIPSLIAIAKREERQKARDDLHKEMLEREDRAYAQGLAHRNYLNP